jgi:hypothetical protein
MANRAGAPTDAEKLACARRELAFRRRVYPRFVSEGRMTAVEAEREIAMMAAIVGDYQAVADAMAPRLL